MRKTMDTKKFSPNIRLLWYTAALSGLLLFCFVPASSPKLSAAEPIRPNEVPLSVILQEDTESHSADADADADSPVFLMQGDCGTAVYRLQSQLQSLGYDIGECTGVYNVQTASAVRRFQLDSGFIGDGVCSAAVSYAIAYLSGDGGEWGSDISEEQLCDALRASGCWSPTEDSPTEAMPMETQLRNALMLFQRTHGLCGTGSADYATLCALGLLHGDPVFGAMHDSGDAADAALFDLRCRQLTEALAEYVLRCPSASDLYTLTACAAVLCNRVSDARFPGSFDAVCAAGLHTDTADNNHRQPTEAAVEKRARDLLLLRAAEDALRAHLSSPDSDPAHGALYVQPADQPLPKDAKICMHTKDYVFFR